LTVITIDWCTARWINGIRAQFVFV